MVSSMSYKKAIRVLYVDLEKRSFKIKDREDLLSEYLGGIGVGVKLFYENISDEEPLSKNQPIVISNGLLTPFFPCATKSQAIFRSPLTGEYGESHAGGRIGLAMKNSGVDAIVIKGASKVPIYLSIINGVCHFKPAEPLWYMASKDAGEVIRRREPFPGQRTIMRIGPAGIFGINFSNVVVDTYRHFGRLGLGRVFGSKKLLAIMIAGDMTSSDLDLKKYRNLYKKIYEMVVRTDVMRKYHEFGTATNVIALNKLNSLPTRNLSSTNFEFAQNLSGETFAKKLLIRKIACCGCPIGCIHVGIFRKQFGKQADYEYTGISYDYELIYSLGSMIGIKNCEDVIELIEACEAEGLDAIATGVTLAWMTEAYQKGLIKREDIEEDIDFGKKDAYIKVIGKITRARTEFYKEVAKGPYELAKTFGGIDFVATLGKNPMAGYHTGYASLLGQSIVGARHSHVDNGGYSIDIHKGILDPKATIFELVQEEMKRNVLNCLGICLFAREVYTKELIEEILSVIGIDVNIESLSKRIFELKNEIKKRFGFDPEKVYIPKRYFETPSGLGKLEESFFEEARKYYSKNYFNMRSN